MTVVRRLSLGDAGPVHAGTEISHDSGLALSPYSETGARLKIKTVDVQGDVRNGLARTTLTTVFSNTIEQPCQASLDLTVPPAALIEQLRVLVARLRYIRVGRSVPAVGS